MKEEISGQSALLVGYLTLVSDLDLAPGTDQFVASLPVRYINSVFFSMDLVREVGSCLVTSSICTGFVQSVITKIMWYNTLNCIW